MKYFNTLILFLMTASIFGQDKKGFTISGFIQGLDRDTIVYLILNEKKDTIHQTSTKNGKFTFNGELTSTAEWASIRVARAKKWPTFLLQTENMKITGSIKEWRSAIVTGSKETDYLYECKKRIKHLDDAIESNNDLILNGASNKYDIIEMNKNLRYSRLLILSEFIHEHPNSVYTAWLIKNISHFDVKRKQIEYERLSLAVQKSNFGLQLVQSIKAFKLQNTIKPGAICPDFKLQTLEGDTISLKGILSMGKLTLLDFWASWCKPCRASIPELKRIYERFHNSGFNILSISSDNNKNAWKKAVEKDKMNWINAKAIDGDNNPSDIFDVQGIPAYVLLDSTGKIIALKCILSSIPSFGFEGKGHTIYYKVAEMLGKLESEDGKENQ